MNVTCVSFAVEILRAIDRQLIRPSPACLHSTGNGICIPTDGINTNNNTDPTVR